MLNKLKEDPIFLLGMGLVIGLVVGALILILSRAPRGEAIQLLAAPSPEAMVVHVSGAVENPGLHEIECGSRTQDAINLAGGSLEDPDLERVNLALIIEDGLQIIVPFLNQPAGQVGGLININRVSAAELEALPGIGPVSAEAIVEYRFSNGPFAAIQDIMQVPGSGRSTFDEISELIDIQG